MRDFCPVSVAKIQRYDADNNTNMLETLEKYFLYVNEPVEAAKSLNIHRNTLLYRINKIKEITGVDIFNGEERLKIQMYMKFIECQQYTNK